MSSLATNAITDAAGGNTATINSFTPTVSNMAGRNRLINSDMRIDQRNAGASVSIGGNDNKYSTDRWNGFNGSDGVFTLQQISDAPAGTNSLRFTTTTADASLGATQFVGVRQMIEGFNAADLGFGAAGASSVTLSFWTKSSLTGTFGGALLNSAENRSYPFNYTINAANTWEYKTVIIIGDTTGTWLTNNGIAFRLTFGLGVGSSYSSSAGAWTSTSYTYSVTGAVSVIGTLSATWQVTGVQLEAGSVATPFEHRQYGQELALCQRYAQQVVNGEVTTQAVALGHSQSGTVAYYYYQMPVAMRSGPALTYSSLSDFLNDDGVGGSVPATLSVIRSTTVSCGISATGLSTAAGRAAHLRAQNSNARLLLSSEL
jgi:hypothetical protein